MQMTRSEMQHRFKNMDSDHDRYQILAELNGCPRYKIVDFLSEVCYDESTERKTKPKYEGYIIKKDPIKNARAIKMYEYGCSLCFIVRVLDISKNGIQRWITLNGLDTKKAYSTIQQYKDKNIIWQGLVDKGEL